MKRFLLQYCALLVLFSNICFANQHHNEYLYPLAYTQNDDEITVYLLYQKSLSHLELWLWDPATKIVSKGLLSTFTPAGFKLLPDKSGFSFIDNDRIRIKHFNKRSPKSLEINEPLYDFTVIEWITNHCFYLSAQERDRFGIFHVDINGEVTRLITNKTADYRYPQKVDSTLFYIERSLDFEPQYVIKSAPYPNFPFMENNDFNTSENFDERVAEILQKNQCEKSSEDLIKEQDTTVVLDFGSKPIIFLSMTSVTSGYCIEHPLQIDRYDKTILFFYHYIWQADGSWHSRKLFSFEIPSLLLLPTNESRLYESLLPLLPRIINQKIYFVDSNPITQFLTPLNLNFYYYDQVLNKQVQKTFVSVDNYQYFCPLQVNNTLYHGGTVLFDDSKVKPLGIHIWVDEGQEVCLELPKIKWL